MNLPERWKNWDEVPLILTTVDVAHLTGLATRTLEGRRLRKEPPPWRRMGGGLYGKVYYLKDEVRQWLEERPQPPAG